jgi:NAD(P)H-dependent FMN reductase
MWKWLCIFCVAVSSTVLSAEVKVLAFSGSTREGSVNRKLVNEAANMARQMGANVTVVDLREYQLPFFDEDLEAKEGIPSKGKQLRQLMSQSQVIFIASPEYNGSLSAVLKNTIDWASRDDEEGKPSTAFKGKKFVIMSASPGSRGGVRGLNHLRDILGNVGGTVVTQQFSLPDSYSAFDAQGHLKNAQQKQELQKLVQSAIQ